MARPDCIELGEGSDLVRIPILYEDRSALAMDKPAGWMLVPFTWQYTQLNLPAAITSSIQAGDFWARSRNLKFLRNVHRLDADTTGILLWAKSIGAVKPYSELFKSRRMEKTYLAVVSGKPKVSTWSCHDPLGRDPQQVGRMRVDTREGQEAETHFRVIATHRGNTLVEARPTTGRTHQIRVHLLQAGHPILGDSLYAPAQGRLSPGSRPGAFPLALRAVELCYPNPFLRRRVQIRASVRDFLRAYGFPAGAWPGRPSGPPEGRGAREPDL